MSDPILYTQNLTRSFGALKATDDLCFEVHKNHLHAIIGPNGAGKTTLVNQLSGDIFPDSGDIFFEGRKITRLKGYKRARIGISRSFQITHIFENLSVAENMALAINAHAGHNFHFLRNWRRSRGVRDQLELCLEQVDLLHRADVRASHLSHGEKRQLEVGMVLVDDPQLLILDEPMAGMGAGGTVEMSRLINKLKGKMTILLIEHDMNVIFSLADMITVLVYGKNIATGTADEIRAVNEVQLAYLGEAG